MVKTHLFQQLSLPDAESSISCVLGQPVGARYSVEAAGRAVVRASPWLHFVNMLYFVLQHQYSKTLAMSFILD